MDAFCARNYEAKIETFDACMIDENARREVSGGETAAEGERSSPRMALSATFREENRRVDRTAGSDPRVEEPATTTTTTTTTAAAAEQRRRHDHRTDPVSRTPSSARRSMTPIRLPAILDGEFFTVIRVEDSNVTVRCSQCQKHLNGNLKSTGNFLSHIRRVHPFMVDKIKCKSNQRKPAMIYIDVSTDDCPEIVRTKRGYRKCYGTEEWQPGNEEASERSNEWSDGSYVRRRKLDEAECSDLLKMSHNDSYMVEDEFDAIGRNVAAKLRNMRLDQRIIAEKLLNDILFEAQLGNLHRDSNIHV